MGPGTHVPRRGKGTHRGLKRVGEVVRARANAGPEVVGAACSIWFRARPATGGPAEGHIKRVAVNPGVGTVRCTGRGVRPLAYLVHL